MLKTDIKEDPAFPLSAGTLLASRYQLGHVLVDNAVTMVFQAHDTSLRRDVAVKFFLAKRGAAELTPPTEARILVELAHVGLPTVYDIGEYGSYPFVIMHLIQGRTLQEICDVGDAEEVTVTRIGIHIARVLAHIHARQYAHLNVESTNILVGPDDDSYLVGFSKCRQHKIPKTNTPSEFSADVHALGCVLLDCLRNRSEPSTTSTVQQLERVLIAMTHVDPVRQPTAACAAALLSAIADLHGSCLPPS